jgi:hypothetical protein
MRQCIWSLIEKEGVCRAYRFKDGRALLCKGWKPACEGRGDELVESEDFQSGSAFRYSLNWENALDTTKKGGD